MTGENAGIGYATARQAGLARDSGVQEQGEGGGGKGGAREPKLPLPLECAAYTLVLPMYCSCTVRALLYRNPSAGRWSLTFRRPAGPPVTPVLCRGLLLPLPLSCGICGKRPKPSCDGWLPGERCLALLLLYLQRPIRRAQC